MKNIAVFASGSGSNAAELMRHFHHHAKARIATVVCNNPRAGVIERCSEFNVPCQLIDRDAMGKKGMVLELLKAHSVDFIVLAGFLQMIPEDVVQAFPRRIINVHPALLPAFGGPGMYGSKVHASVLQKAEKISGITIHYVDEHYDSGDIIFQKSVEIEAGETVQSLQQKVQVLEHKYLPLVTDKLINDSINEF